jgi:hypothetical protein
MVSGFSRLFERSLIKLLVADLGPKDKAAAPKSRKPAAALCFGGFLIEEIGLDFLQNKY